MSNRTTEKAYECGQIEALYREIFTLQTRAGWHDKRDFTAWYASRGWSYRRPRDLKMDGAISAALMHHHAISEQKVRQLRGAMYGGQWSDANSDHPITVMADGEIMDGHHRLTTASGVDWLKAPNRPVFTVAFRSDVMPD